jgi:putative ABC transport system permease protein
MSTMDFRYAIRSLRKTPGFTLLAVLVMALGIGANTAVFSVVHTVLLKPLPYRDPDRIVSIYNFWKKGGTVSASVSAPDFHDWRDQASVFEALAYYNREGQTAVVLGTTAEYGNVALVSPDFAKVFAVEPIAGRYFSAEEEKPGGPLTAMISHAFWQSHFGGNSRALGQTISVYDKPLTIIGVFPGNFRFPDKTDIWAPSPALFEENHYRSGHNYRAVGRLRQDTTVKQAQAQMVSIATRLEQQYPESNAGKSVSVVRVLDRMVGSIRTTLYLLLAAVGVVLLIACANMANLLLAKSTSRTREIAIRAAVGASRGRLIRQLITESMVLGSLAGVAGLILAIWGADALTLLAPKNVPRLAETSLDGWVLAFTFGISLVSSVLFGLAPALQASKADLNHTLKQGGARSTLGGAAGRMRSSLVVAEIALSVVLVASAGLLIKSFVALNNVALGFRPERVLVMESSVPSAGLEGAKLATQFYKGLLADIATLPGVLGAGATMAPPGTIGSDGGYWIDRLPPRDQLSVTAPQAVFSIVAPGTFHTLGIPLKSGRDFNPADTYDAPFTAVINEALARRTFPGEDPIGRLIFCGMDSFTGMKIVGVVGDVRQAGPATPPKAEIYMPYEQHPGPSTALHVVVRTANDPVSLAEAMRRKVRERSAQVPVNFTTMEASLAENVATPRFRTLLLGVFAALAMSLAMAGVYGVMAYLVGQRSNEIGLRMALGASSHDVIRLVMRQGLKLAGIGVLLGLAAAAASARLLSSVLFEVKPTDPLTYLAVCALLVVVALAACFIPARRATQVDPLVALRQE